MRTFILTSFVFLFFSLGISAQNGGKPVVYIDFFSRPSGVSEVHAAAIRNKVIEGLQESDRIKLIDVASMEQLNSEEQRRKSESAMADVAGRASQMQTLGADYIILGNITSVEVTKSTDSKGNASYKGSIHWDVKVVDTATGTVKYSNSYTHSGGGLLGGGASTADKAFADTADSAKFSMDTLVNEVFPIEGLILKIESLSKKKDKAQTVIIDLGTALGVTKGQRFIVYMETDIAGEIARKEIGTLNAQEILSAGRTICKVSKGGDKILDASNKDQKLIVVSRKSGLLEF